MKEIIAYLHPRLQLSRCILQVNHLWTVRCMSYQISQAVQPSMQADAAERQLLCELVALYTPEALVAAPAERPRRGRGGGSGNNGSGSPDPALAAYLELLALGVGGGADSVGAAVLRRAALSRASPEFYAAVPADQQARLLEASPAPAPALHPVRCQVRPFNAASGLLVL